MPALQHRRFLPRPPPARSCVCRSHQPRPPALSSSPHGHWRTSLGPGRQACHPAAGGGRGSGLRWATRGVLPTEPRLLRGATRLLRAAQLLRTAPGVLRATPRVLPCAAALLPALARVWAPDAAVLRAAAWLLCTAHVVLWLLWRPRLLSSGRFRLSAPVRISAARRLARHVMAEGPRRLPPWSCAIGSWKSRPSCS